MNKSNLYKSFCNAIYLPCVATLLSAASLCYAQDNNAGFRPASTVQQPTFGVSIDANGVLNAKNFAAPGQLTHEQRRQAAQARLGNDVFTPSPSRVISLKGLSNYLAESVAAKQPFDDTAIKLAGLTRVKKVFVLPQEDDILLIGPAEGWVEDAAGRTVGAFSRSPTILLEDLAVAIKHNADNQNTWCGCSINPREEALTDLLKFNRTIPKAIPQRNRLRVVSHVIKSTTDALGMADVVVFSLPPTCNMARVMVEADYRMKLAAVGLEPLPVRMHSFYSRLQYPPRSTFQRWWFTPDYNCLRLSTDKLAMEIVSDKVVLQTEDYASTKAGQLYHTGQKPSGAASAFATGFTAQYEKIAQASAVYAQLKNMVDLLVIGAYLKHVDAFASTGLNDSLFLTGAESLIPSGPVPRQVPCVANGGWKGNQMITVAGGGVSIEPNKALESDAVEQNAKIPPPAKIKADQWWWDLR